MLNNKIKFFIALFITMSSINLSAGEGVKPHSSADWFFAVRTNVNSAAIVTGIVATWHALYYTGFPATVAGIQYALGKTDKKALSHQLKAVRSQFSKSLFLAGLAIAIEGVNKLYFRPKYYEKIAV